MENPLTLAGIESATFRFVAQHLSHCATAVILDQWKFGTRTVFDVLNLAGGGRMLVRRTVRLKSDGTRAETRFRLSAKRTSPFKSAGGRQFSRLLAAEVCASAGSNTVYNVFRGSVKGTGYPLHSLVSPSLPLHQW